MLGWAANNGARYYHQIQSEALEGFVNRGPSFLPGLNLFFVSYGHSRRISLDMIIIDLIIIDFKSAQFGAYANIIHKK